MSVPGAILGVLLNGATTSHASNQLSPISITIQPIDSNRLPFQFPKYIDQNNVASGFTDYEFDSNILVPADSFSFTFAAPTDRNPYDIVKEGDVVILQSNGVSIFKGVIDAVDMRVDGRRGEFVTIRGRDFLGQLADQSAVDDSGNILFRNPTPISTVASILTANTNIKNIIYQGISKTQTGQFPTFPEESKLAALTRFLESLNGIFWMNSSGVLIIGKPNFLSNDGTLTANSVSKIANVLSYRVTRASTQIPNVIIPVYTGQEIVTSKVAKQQQVYNTATRPAQLRKANYHYSKAITASFITALDAASQTTQQTNLSLAGTQLQALAARLLARYNMNEIEVEVEVPGHVNASGVPYRVDTNYTLNFDRASLQQRMYCYAVRYRLDANLGQTTVLNFCNQNTIVATSQVSPGVG